MPVPVPSGSSLIPGASEHLIPELGFHGVWLLVSNHYSSQDVPLENLIFSSCHLSTGLWKAVMNNQCGLRAQLPRGKASLEALPLSLYLSSLILSLF